MATADEMKAFALRRAGELGFCLAGVAPAAGPEPDGEALRRWVAGGLHASMAYMAEHLDQRCDVRASTPGVRSVLCLAAGYAPAGGGETGPVARFARGRDYHRVLKARAHRLADELRELAGPDARSRTCVDSAPVLERAYARLAGLGWIGRNTCLTNARWGSYLVLCEILLDFELPPDAPVAEGCGDCRRCIDACPTGALRDGRVLDARRCINWATVEEPGPLGDQPATLAGQLLGCDLCQAVCPHNQAVPEGLDELARPGPLVERASVLAVLDWSWADWDAATRGSTARRASWAMWVRNACRVAGEGRLAEARPALARLGASEDPVVRGAAREALARLGG